MFANDAEFNIINLPYSVNNFLLAHAWQECVPGSGWAAHSHILQAWIFRNHNIEGAQQEQVYPSLWATMESSQRWELPELG